MYSHCHLCSFLAVSSYVEFYQHKTIWALVDMSVVLVPTHANLGIRIRRRYLLASSTSPRLRLTTGKYNTCTHVQFATHATVSSREISLTELAIVRVVSVSNPSDSLLRVADCPTRILGHASDITVIH